MHEMQTIVTDVRSVCLSVSMSQLLNYLAFTVRGSFDAAFVKLLCPLVIAATVRTEAGKLPVRDANQFDPANRFFTLVSVVWILMLR